MMVILHFLKCIIHYEGEALSMIGELHLCIWYI